MKKSIFALGLMFAALTLTNCTKNEEENIVPETKGQAFELFANADTRTTNDGMSTKWAADDALNVFHAVAGTADYKDDGSFSIAETDLASGRFTGALSGALEDGATYDWYLFYPYKSQITTPANTSGYTQIGQRSDRTQTQTDKDNMAHVAGPNYPLYGQATVEKGEAVNVTMQHIASLIAVNVTNNAAEDIKVSKISFVAPKKIVGAYYIDFSGKSIIYKEHTTASFTSATATLEVTGDATIAAGQSAKFYLGIKPFTAAAGETLTITVSTDKGDCVKTLELKTATTFTAGKIKTLNFGFVAPEDLSMYWDLSIDQTSTATADKISWSSDIANMQVTKGGGSTTDCNNYYPGTANKSYTSTRFYSGHSFSITPNAGYTISKIVFEATKESYAQVLPTATWTNATCENSGVYVNIIPANGDNKISTKIPGTCGFKKATIYYSVTQKSLKLDAPTITSASGTVDAITASWNKVEHATAYAWELYKGGDKEKGGTLDKNSTYAPDNLNAETVTLTIEGSFTAGEKYVLYVKSLGDGENYLNSDEASVPISFGGTSGDEGGKGASYQYTFTAKQFSSNTTMTLDGLSWTIAGDGNYWGYDGTKGQQFGSGKAPYKTLTVTLDYDAYCTGKGTSGGVEKIIINTSGASSINATFIVKVGGTQIGESTKLTTSATNYTFEVTDKNNLPTGDIIIEYTQTSSKAMYIKSISVNN